MDNITHSLVGAVLSSALCDCWEKRTGGKIRTPLPLVASVGANNFPDLDLLYTHISVPLGYLLHHRGHTHTFVLAPLQGVLVYLGALLIARAFGLTLSKIEKIPLLLLSVFGPVIHLMLDSLNSYGVHPFWPFSNRWYYGDTLFIVEPAGWLILLSYLLARARTLPERSVYLFLTVVAVGLITLSGYVPPLVQLMVLVLFALFVVGMRIIRGTGTRSVAVIVSYLLLLMAFSTASFDVKETIRERPLQEGYKTLDVVVSPSPANPFCWNYLHLLRSSHDLLVNEGTVALFSPSLCPGAKIARESTAPASPPSPKGAYLPGVMLDELFLGTLPLTEMARLERNCNVSAFLRFARVPWLMGTDAAVRLIDLRFERVGRGNFAEMLISEAMAEKCVENVPPWDYPRSDLFH